MSKKTLSPDAVPEMQRYLAAAAAVEQFKETHSILYEELRNLVGELNAARDAADKVLRPQEASCGPFDCYNVTLKYDAETLYEQVGPADFAQYGGTVRRYEATEYTIDKKTFESRILAGQVPKDVVAVVQKRTPTYHAPKPAALP